VNSSYSTFANNTERYCYRPPTRTTHGSLFPLHCGFCVVDVTNLIQKSQVWIKPNLRQSISLHGWSHM